MGYLLAEAKGVQSPGLDWIFDFLIPTVIYKVLGEMLAYRPTE